MQPATIPAHYSKLVQRLPITFRPFINEKLAGIDRLFSYERKSVESFLSYIEGLNEDLFELLFRPLVAVEKKMGVEHWVFSNQAETLENTSLLAHSPYYQEWRRAIQGIFDEVSSHSLPPTPAALGNGRRVVLIILPRSLPVKMDTVWKEWPAQGRQLNLAAIDSSSASCSEILLGSDGTGLLSDLARTAGHSIEDMWILDAGSTLSSVLPVHATAGSQPTSIYLSFSELATFRDAFRDRLNWIQKDLADADKVIAGLRDTDVTPWCPPALKSQVATREFVKDLFLSGNGSVVFGNAFVQWSANEAFRRARPRTLVACFGMRNKPKPFTSIAILEDQEHTSPVPDTPDPDGSAIDASILARYVWLAASRYDEYKDALCLVIADALPSIYAIAPPGHDPFSSQTMTIQSVSQIVRDWMS